MAAFAYTLAPTLGPTSDPLVAVERDTQSLRLRAQKDWLYDFETGDIVIPRQLVTGVDAIVQRAMIRVRFVLGEWFLDTRLGVPYLQRVLVSSPNLAAIQQLFTAVFLSVPYIDRVEGMKLTLDKARRRLRVDGFTLILSDGSRIIVAKPFIV